jgi:hypothetical protein
MSLKTTKAILMMLALLVDFGLAYAEGMHAGEHMNVRGN